MKELRAGYLDEKAGDRSSQVFAEFDASETGPTLPEVLRQLRDTSPVPVILRRTKPPVRGQITSRKYQVVGTAPSQRVYFGISAPSNEERDDLDLIFKVLSRVGVHVQIGGVDNYE